jgi:uncharacterized membrane protein YdcZ (DUF606 family)
MRERTVSAPFWRVHPLMWLGGAVAGALVAGTAMLWTHYGSTLFFEMIVAGLASCF